jgi:hypothetical protein
MKALRSITLLGAVAVLAACSADSPMAIEESAGAVLSVVPSTEPLPLVLCKSWADVATPPASQLFNFTVTANGVSTSVDVAVWECANLGPYAPGTEVTIRENVPSGFAIDAIWRITRLAGTEEILSNPTTTATTFRVDDYGLIFFKNVARETPPPTIFAGCTPGFWRQSQHAQYWTGFSPAASFADVFGVARPGTLLENIRANGGGAHALARHAVAALLNAASADVAYPYSTGEIIAAVQDAFASGQFESAKDRFEAANELGCSVDKSRR